MEHTPTGCLWQEGPFEWLHLPVTPRKIVLSYPNLVTQLILKGRKRSVELFFFLSNKYIHSIQRASTASLLQNSDW